MPQTFGQCQPAYIKFSNTIYVFSFKKSSAHFECLKPEKGANSKMADVSNRPNSTIYVGGLHPTLVTSAVLSDAFIPFGEISDVSLPKPEAPSSTDLHRGFGYVEFEEAGDAKEAVNNMDQSELYGRIIKVAMAKPERKADEPGGIGSKTAIWEQVGRLRSVRPLPRILGPWLIKCVGRISG